MKLTKCGQWIFRDGELSMPAFIKSTSTERKEYLELIKSIPTDERSTMDQYLVELYNLDKKQSQNYFEL
jgi:hypothetical protein